MNNTTGGLATSGAGERQAGLASLVVHRESVQADQECGQVYEAFGRHEHEYMAVLDGARPCGLVSRSRLGFLMGSRFGYSLFHRKPIVGHWVEDFVAVREEADLVPLMAEVLSRSGAAFHHDVIVLGRDGSYEGILTIQRLARMQSELLARKLSELEARNQRLVEKTDELLAATVALNQNNAELAAARAAAMEGSRLKSLFLAKVSHELRTPMNGIIGFTELLLDTSLTDEQGEFARTVLGSATGLLNVLTDILEFAQVEAGRVTIDLHPVRLAECFRDVIERLRPQADAKGLRLSSDVAESMEDAVLADAERWRQILTHLLANAIKFTVTGGVELRAWILGGSGASRLGRVEVRDTGPGVSADQLPSIFEAFRQGDDGYHRAHGGLGLGLSLVKHHVELMGGTTGVVSGPSGGSIFWLEVPLALAPSDTGPGSVFAPARPVDPRPVGRLAA